MSWTSESRTLGSKLVNSKPRHSIMTRGVRTFGTAVRSEHIVFVEARYKHVRCTNSKLRALYTRLSPARWPAEARSTAAARTHKHQIPTRGSNWPLLSAEYGVGAALSKVAECSRLQLEHFQTKLAVAFLPDMRERSSYTKNLVGDYSRRIPMFSLEHRPRTYCAIHRDQIWVHFSTVATLYLIQRLYEDTQCSFPYQRKGCLHTLKNHSKSSLAGTRSVTFSSSVLIDRRSFYMSCHWSLRLVKSGHNHIQPLT